MSMKKFTKKMLAIVAAGAMTMGLAMPAFAATSKDLYVAYCRWCNDNLDVPVSERSFARRFKERSADYGMTYDKNISVGNGRFCRGFRGVHVKVRTKDVNY